MKKEFVSYELAVKLKELGFDEECIATVSNIGSIHVKKTRRLPSGSMCTLEVNAPLWQQSFDWFREEYRLFSSFMEYSKDFANRNHKIALKKCNYCIISCAEPGEKTYPMKQEYFETYEQTRYACLEKLIEIVENEKNNK